MKSFFFQFLILLIIVNSNFAQTIVNTEKLFSENDNHGLVFASELYGNAISGNADVFLLEYSANAAYQKNKTTMLLLSGGEYISEDKELVSNSLFGQFRFIRSLGEKQSLYSYYQIQRNEVLLLNRRQLLGLGYKVDLIKIQKDSIRDFKLSMSLSAMQEEEVLDRNSIAITDVAYKNLTRAVFNTTIGTSITEDFSIVNTMYYQQAMDLKDFRFLNEVNFIFQLTQALSFSVDFEYRYDSDPPSVLKQSDFNFNFGIQLNIE